MTTTTRTRNTVWALAAGGLLLVAAPAFAQSPLVSTPAASATPAAAPAPQAPTNEGVVSEQTFTFGVNALNLTGDNPARFYQGKSITDGFQLPALKWSISNGAGNYLQVDGSDLFQADELFKARAGMGGTFAARFDWSRLPWVVGDGARSPWAGVGTGRLTITPDLRAALEDPDGDGVLGTAADNALVPDAARRHLAATDPISPAIERNTANLTLEFTPTSAWSIDVGYRREDQEGLRAAGTGTYHRLTFPAASGLGLDETFSNRGAEILRPIDYATTTFQVGTGVRGKQAFGDVSMRFVDFSNRIESLTYDHPLWLTPIFAGSPPAGLDRNWGRGLWEIGRVPLAPDSQSWYVTATGGFSLPRSTRLTATVQRGQITQDSAFVPLIANAAATGRVDLNGDGVINSADDGTIVDTLPKRSLDGTVNTTSFTLSFSTRPAKPLTINVRLPYYDYDSQHGEILFPYRGYYTDSYWSASFQGKPNLARPLDFSRRAFFAEAIVRPTDQFTIRAFGENQHRTYATRAVSATDTNAFGVGAGFFPAAWADVRITYRVSKREFEGTYTPTFAGEQQALRMFDIANLDQNGLTLDVSLDPTDRVSLGARMWYRKDEYPDSTFGLQETKTTGGGFDLAFRPSETASLFVYVDLETYDFNGRGDTKMGVFNVSGNDWFYAIADKTTSFGGGLNADLVPDKYRLDLNLSYVKGTVNQSNRNTGTPTSTLAATAENFPEQASTMTSGEVRITRTITPRLRLGAAYLFEDFQLSDFAWDNLGTYGFDVLTVDDNLRYTLLDLRYGSYTAHLGHVFLTVSF